MRHTLSSCHHSDFNGLLWILGYQLIRFKIIPVIFTYYRIITLFSIYLRKLHLPPDVSPRSPTASLL